LAAGAEVAFTVTNSVIEPVDTIIVNIASGNTSQTIAYISAVGTNSFQITLANHGAEESGAIVINFAVFRGASS